MHQLPYGLAGHRKDEVEQLEREENKGLVGIALYAIKNSSFVAIAKHESIMWPELMLTCTLRI
jgi:hypothetical protein